MQPIDSDLGDGDPKGMALSILRTMGIGALPMAEAKIAECGDRPDLAERWTAIVASMRAIVEVDHHMTIALDLLDTVELHVAAAKLDGAIVELGLRSPEATAFIIERDAPEKGTAYYEHRAATHLQLASDHTELAAKGRHLDLASRYATLGELVARATSPQADPLASIVRTSPNARPDDQAV